MVPWVRVEVRKPMLPKNRPSGRQSARLRQTLSRSLRQADYRPPTPPAGARPTEGLDAERNCRQSGKHKKICVTDPDASMATAMESFFSSMKTERIALKVYRTRDQARADMFEYIVRFYNPRRRHSTIGYLSSMEFERMADSA